MVVKGKLIVVNVLSLLIVLGLVTGPVGTAFLANDDAGLVTELETVLPIVDEVMEEKIVHDDSCDDITCNTVVDKYRLSSTVSESITLEGGKTPEPLASLWGNWSFRDGHNVPEAEALGYSGNDVVVALADTGIDFGIHNLAGKYKVEDRTYSVADKVVLASAEGGETEVSVGNHYLIPGTITASINGTATPVTVVENDGIIQFAAPLLYGERVTCSYDYYAPNYGWPMAFDPYALAPFIQSGKVAPTGWYANTSKNGTGPFDVDHEIEIDGRNDFSNIERVGQDLQADVKDPGTATGLEFDLSFLYATRDEDFWYFGTATRYAALNRTFGFAIDMDGPASGGVTDPKGNYLNFEPSHPSPIEQLAYDPNSGYIASCAGAGYGGTQGLVTNSFEINMVKIWGADGSVVTTLSSELYPVHSVAWSPDGSLLAYGTKTDLVVIDTSDWSELYREEHTTNTNPSYQKEAISFNNDGSELAVGSYIGGGSTIMVMDTTDGSTQTPLMSGDISRSVEYSPDGSQLAMGHTSSGQITIMETAGYTTTKSFMVPGKTNPVEVVAWSPDGTKLATGQDSYGTITIWDIASETVIGSLTGGHISTSTINSIKWYAGTIMTGATDGRVIFWDDAAYTPTAYNSKNNEPVYTADINTATGDVFVGTYDCTIRKHDRNAWNPDSYTAFIAHKADTVVYIKYEREYYEETPEGLSLLVESDKIEVPEVFRWNEGTSQWDETNVTAEGGEFFYKGMLAGEFTEKGFIEFSIPRDYIGWNTSNTLYVSSFICGDNKSKPQDTCPSDFNVPSPTLTVPTDFVSTDIVGISSFAKVDIPKTTVTHADIQSVTGDYHYGYHPSKALTAMVGPVSLIVVESATAGTWDRVYLDMNTDYVIDGNDVWVDRDNPNVLYDWWNLSADAAVNGTIDPDGLPDVSGGFLYFIGDGRTQIPYSERLGEINGIVYGEGYPLLDVPVPEPGEVLAFFGDFDYNEDTGAMETHGTKMASAIAGQGLNDGDFGPILGMSPGITFLPICNAHADDDSWEAALYFAVDGYDGEPNTGDEAQIVTIGQFESEYNSGLDVRSQFVEYIANVYADKRATFIAPSGNDGNGYGTVAAPSGPSTIVVGQAEDNTFASDNSGPDHHFSDVSELSSRGPNAAGLIKPDVIALGAGEVDLPLGATMAFSSSIGGGIQSKQVWSSSELAAAVATGALALAFESYYDATHDVDNEVVIQATMTLTSGSLDHIPVVPGSYVIKKNGNTLSEPTDYSLDAATGIISFTQNVSKGDWVNASYTYSNEYPWLDTAMDILTSSALDLGNDPFTQGHGFVDAFNAVQLAGGMKGLKSSPSSKSFGDSFNKEFDAFVNVLPSGGSDAISIEVSNEGATTENADYTFEYYQRIGVENYSFKLAGIPAKFQKDISGMIPWNAQLVKITVQSPYDNFIEKFGSYVLSLYDWKDTVNPGQSTSKLGIVDVNDPLSLIMATDHPVHANALVCSIANPHANMEGNLLMQINPNPDASPPVALSIDVEWTLTVESFAIVDWAWGSLDKSSASIAGGVKDTVVATVDVPANAYAGTYGASVVAAYDALSNYHTEMLTTPMEYEMNAWLVDDGVTLTTFDDVLYDTQTKSYLNYSVDVFSCNVSWNMTPLTLGVDYTYDQDTGQITFLTTFIGGGGASGPELKVDYGVARVIHGVALPHKRIETGHDIGLYRTEYDGSVSTLTENVDYTFNPLTGTVNLTSLLGGLSLQIFSNYTYKNRTTITPLSLNVFASDVANFAFGDLDASEDDLSVMPVWGLRPGYGSTTMSGDRRYFYVHIPDQGLFTTPENFYLYTEAIWDLNETDINVYVLAEDDVGIDSNNIAPYTLDDIGGSEENVNFEFVTATHGPKEILLTPFSAKLVTICVSAKTFNGTSGPIQKFEGRGGWINLDNPKTWTNNQVGHMTIKAYSSFEFESGISASIVGPAQGVKTTEPIIADSIEYDFTLEGWLSINANADFTKVVKVENALSWDVHCIGLGGATDLDLAIFLDGYNGGNIDGVAQWMEIVTKDVCDFDAYKNAYGRTPYWCYCADYDADEALKLIAPPDGDYIIKVLGYTVNPSPGEMTLEIKTILAGVEGYKMQGVDTQYEDENPSESGYENHSSIAPFSNRSFDIIWNFPENTEDNIYGGILVLGVPEAPELIVISVEIDLDREAPNIEPAYTGPNSITADDRPSISANLFDRDKGEISQDVRVFLDGVDMSVQANIGLEETEKGGGSADVGYWNGQALYTPSEPLTEGGHYFEVRVKDYAENHRTRGWYFTVDTEAPVIDLIYPMEKTTYVNSNIVTITGTAELGIDLDVYGVMSSKVNQKVDGTFTAVVTLSDGANTVEIRGTDSAGNVYRTQMDINVDTAAPGFDRLKCLAGTLTNSMNTALSGSMSETGTLTINGDPTPVNADGSFIKYVELTEGVNVFAFGFQDRAGNAAYRWFNVTLDTIAPAIDLDSIASSVTADTVDISGSTESGAYVRINGKLVQVSGTRQGTSSFTKAIKLSPGVNTLVIESEDSAGNINQEYITVSFDAAGTNWGAIGLMIVLLVVGLLVGILVARMLFGGPVEEKDEDLEEDIPSDEDLEDKPSDDVDDLEDADAIPTEEAEADDLPDADEDIPDEDMEAEPLEEEPPMDEAEPEEVPEEDLEAEGDMPEEMEPEPLEEEPPMDDAEPDEVPDEAEPAAEEDPKIANLRKAYEEGKISEELYEKNLAKFQGK